MFCCRVCLIGHINNADNVLDIICPHVEKGFFRDDRPCTQKFNDIEIMYLLKNDFKAFSKYMIKRQNQNELARAKSRVHCVTPDCTGYFEVTEFGSSERFGVVNQ